MSIKVNPSKCVSEMQSNPSPTRNLSLEYQRRGGRRHVPIMWSCRVSLTPRFSGVIVPPPTTQTVLTVFPSARRENRPWLAAKTVETVLDLLWFGITPLKRGVNETFCKLCLAVWLLLPTLPAFAINDRVTDWLSDEVKFNPGGLTLGPFDLRPRLSGTVVYDDNIYIHSQTNQSDLIWVLSPGLSMASGNYLRGGERYLKLDYSPSFLFFLDQSQNNSIDHDANLSGQWQIAKLTLNLQQLVQVSSGGVLEAGNRVRRHIYNTSIAGTYPLGDKTSLEITARQTINDYESLIGSKEWSEQNFVDYLWTPKTTVGLGLTLGYRDVDQNPGQTYEQFLTRVSYGYSGKTDFHATFGGELAQYGGSGGRSSFGPVFSLGVGYRPYDATTVSLEAYRRDQNSAVLAGQNYTTTGVSASARQRFLHKMFFTLGGGYDNLDYHATTTGVSANREDNYLFLRFNFEWNVTPRWLVGAFYLRRENHSNTLPFSNNQVGVQSAFTF